MVSNNITRVTESSLYVEVGMFRNAIAPILAAAISLAPLAVVATTPLRAVSGTVQTAPVNGIFILDRGGSSRVRVLAAVPHVAPPLHRMTPPHVVQCPAHRERANGVVLYGPGDVVGFDPRHVIRVSPPNFGTNVRPDAVVEIDFDAIDFPWQFSPCPPTPWITLVVLKTSEFTPAAGQYRPLPAIMVTDAASLPDLSAMPAYTGVRDRTTGQDRAGPPSPAVAQQVMASPASAFSYIRSPRALEPNTSYVAFLVPTFFAGVQAGLGQSAAQNSTTSTDAWVSGQRNVLLPYYYTFRFKTQSLTLPMRVPYRITMPHRPTAPGPVPSPAPSRRSL
ncbi:MAG: hypothetical protein ACYDBO_08530 [Vulcanimicrobiaceae bacterium]